MQYFKTGQKMFDGVAGDDPGASSADEPTGWLRAAAGLEG